ncbi:MAG: alanine racemase [Chloroflexota bacterium]
MRPAAGPEGSEPATGAGPEALHAVDAEDAAALRPHVLRRAWMSVDTAALAHNLLVLAGLAGPGARVAAVIKADAYGHGLVPAARTFLAAGAAMVCVATVDEVLALRAAGITAPILLLYPPPIAAVDALVAAGVTIPVSSEEGGRELAAELGAAAARHPRPVTIHLEVETGLTRMGVPPERCPAVASSLAAIPGVRIEALWSHLATPEDPASASGQLAELDRATALMRGAGIDVPLRHLAASGGLLAGTVPALDLVRPGLALYGVLPDDLPVPPARQAAAASLRPAMSLHARPIRLLEVGPGASVSYGGRWTAERPSRIMTLPVGYGDGYARGTGPGAEVLVAGRRAPVVGSIAMDALMVDVTEIPEAGPDSDVVLLGRQGGERIDAAELARKRTTIAWEVLTAMARRLPRVYHAAAGERTD